MTKISLYQQITEAIRQQILQETLHPGDRLPPVRDTAAQWHCTIGTVQRAYDELARQGLVVSRAGQGTHVAAAPPPDYDAPLRQAALVHRAEAFLLEALTVGHTPAEVEQALRLALDRWRVLSRLPAVAPQITQPLRFVGSHDPAVTLLAARLTEWAGGQAPQFTFAGSLGGLMALARGEADVAGSHLWDEENDTYNAPFVSRLLPGRRIALLTLAHRRLGLLVAPASPIQPTNLAELTQSGLRFINRQRGAGTRVWLDAQLRHLGLNPAQINGYNREAATHSEVARLIAEGQAEVGLGVETVALAYGLRFTPLTLERYDWVIPLEVWEIPAIQALAHWLTGDAAKAEIMALGGYDVRETGRIAWLG